MKIHEMAIIVLGSFSLGATVMMTYAAKYGAEPATKIVCESGSFEPASDGEYLREQATCNVNDVNGRAIQVLIID